MADNYWAYWFAIDHGEQIYKSVKDIILFDEDNSLEKILKEPTIFLANHTSTLDIPHMHFAIQKTLAKHPRDANRMIRTISKDDNYRNKGLLGLLHNNIFNIFAVNAGAIMVKPIDSTNPKPRSDPLRPMIATLSIGSHVLVYPMGGVSEDGRVDYKRAEDLLTFEYKHLALIARRMPRANVQTMHYTIDPVHNNFLIRMGQRYLIKDMKDYDFSEEIGKCTTITGLQLLALYTKIAQEAGIKHTTQSLSDELSAFSDELQSKGYYLHNPDKTMDDVISFADSRNPYILDLNYTPVNIADPAYQANQIRHLSLDAVARRFLKTRKVI